MLDTLHYRTYKVPTYGRTLTLMHANTIAELIDDNSCVCPIVHQHSVLKLFLLTTHRKFYVLQ